MIFLCRVIFARFTEWPCGRLAADASKTGTSWHCCWIRFDQFSMWTLHEDLSTVRYSHIHVNARYNKQGLACWKNRFKWMCSPDFLGRAVSHQLASHQHCDSYHLTCVCQVDGWASSLKSICMEKNSNIFAGILFTFAILWNHKTTRIKSSNLDLSKFQAGWRSDLDHQIPSLEKKCDPLMLCFS